MNFENQKNLNIVKNTNMDLIVNKLEDLIIEKCSGNKNISKTDKGIVLKDDDSLSIVDLNWIVCNQDKMIDNKGDCWLSSLRNLKNLWRDDVKELYWSHGIILNEEGKKIWHCWIENKAYCMDEQFGKRNLVKKDVFKKRVLEQYLYEPHTVRRKFKKIQKQQKQWMRKYPGC